MDKKSTILFIATDLLKPLKWMMEVQVQLITVWTHTTVITVMRRCARYYCVLLYIKLHIDIFW